ncbi:unnamed protein product [Adineta ricciae]|uniref:Reverse transcriptase domain-containing protein n=1 Tax=Adineta ricciae TaxID=249248 RepID=A0A815L1V3_ADIRI|nr:unnamed protein product [Adineta ricciae]CAF1529472.1 unnamed protein product [Adineta ricciae]
MLNVKLQGYENKIEDQEYLYQQEVPSVLQQIENTNSSLPTFQRNLTICHIKAKRQSIQATKCRLKKYNQILRVTDKAGIFHFGDTKDCKRKAGAYRQKAGAYVELETNPLRSVFDKVELAYLYFVPKPHKEETPLRPIVLSMSKPTTSISKFLDRLLRPLFDKHVRSTTIIDGVDLIRRLETYAANGYLKPTTHLCTFDITDLYTILPQEESLNILTQILMKHGYRKVRGVPTDAIRKLARLVSTENVFIYEKKFYR